MTLHCCFYKQTVSDESCSADESNQRSSVPVCLLKRKGYITAKTKRMNDDKFNMTSFLSKYASESTGEPASEKDDDEFQDKDKLPEIDEDLFCTPLNIEERLQYLNNEISILGFPSILNDVDISNERYVIGDFDMTKLVNCSYNLISRHRRQMQYSNEMQQRQSRNESHISTLLQTQDRLKQDLENRRRELAMSALRDQDWSKKCSCLQQDLKTCRDEKKKMKMDVDHLKKQFIHESKRMEKETCKLRDKVHQLLSDKGGKGKNVSIELPEPFMRSDGKRSKWKTPGKKDEEMLRLVIRNFEEKEKVILSENHMLRESLGEIQCWLEAGNSADPPPASSEDCEVEKNELQMPYHLVKEDTVSRIKGMINSLKNSVHLGLGKTDITTEPTEDITQALNEEIEELTSKLKESKLTIANYVNMNQFADGKEEAYERVLAVYGYVEDESELLLERKKIFREELKNLEKHKKVLLECAAKMEAEKREFERERTDFYSYCLTSPIINRDFKMRGSLKESHDLNTPPTPRSKNRKMPSTGELYKYFSLSFNESQSKRQGNSGYDGGSFPATPESPSESKIRRHSDNIRKAVEERQNKSQDDAFRTNLYDQFNGNIGNDT